MSKRAILLVNSHPASEAQTQEYNTWYSDVHIPQILERVPGFVAARRYVVDEASPTQPEHGYLAVYEIEAEEPAAALAALTTAGGSGRLDSSDALRRDVPSIVVLYREV